MSAVLEPPVPVPGTVDDQVAIMAALGQLTWMLDHRTWDRLGEVMAPDVDAYGAQGLDTVVSTVIRPLLGGCGPSQHLLGNHQIAIAGDEARSMVYARVHHRGAEPDSERWWECMGEYHDDWHRTPEGWRMARRVFVVTMSHGDYSVLQPG
jgi:hypothetical protein